MYIIGAVKMHVTKQFKMTSIFRNYLFIYFMLTFLCGSTEMIMETKRCAYKDDLKCEPGEDYDQDKCNATEEICEKPDEGKRAHCYSAFKFINGTSHLQLQGCWLNDDQCYDRKTCESNTPEPHNDVHFCCCEGDMCNGEVNFDPDGIPQKPTVTPPERVITYPRTQDRMTPLIGSLLPLFGLALIILCAYWLYRRHKGSSYHGPLSQEDANGHLVKSPGGGPNETPLLSELPLTNDALSSVQLLEIKARGRFGCVYKATMKENQTVAVKVFPIQDQDSFINERDFYMLPQINDHENILKFLSTESRGTNLNLEFWLISEYQERGSLYDFLKGNLVTWPEMMNLAVSMARGLAFIHDDIPPYNGYGHKPAVAHRDFKSKNVLVKTDLTACVADFGLALKFEPGKSVGDTHGQVGTRRYMAPEVLEGAINFNRDAFLRIDMYACGLVLWELASRCTGIDGPLEEYRLPFEEEVGQHPTLDDVQEAVVQNKIRPKMKEAWYKHPGLDGLRETMEECWDHDPEARLSAGCIEERLVQLALLDCTSTPTTPVGDAPGPTGSGGDEQQTVGGEHVGDSNANPQQAEEEGGGVRNLTCSSSTSSSIDMTSSVSTSTLHQQQQQPLLQSPDSASTDVSTTSGGSGAGPGSTADMLAAGILTRTRPAPDYGGESSTSSGHSLSLGTGETSLASTSLSGSSLGSSGRGGTAIITVPNASATCPGTASQLMYPPPPPSATGGASSHAMNNSVGQQAMMTVMVPTAAALELAQQQQQPNPLPHQPFTTITVDTSSQPPASIKVCNRQDMMC